MAETHIVSSDTMIAPDCTGGHRGRTREAALVYRDMQCLNIMVKRPKSQDDDGKGKCEDEWHGLLIDLDWAGRAGVVKYPPM